MVSPLFNRGTHAHRGHVAETAHYPPPVRVAKAKTQAANQATQDQNKAAELIKSLDQRQQEAVKALTEFKTAQEDIAAGIMTSPIGY
jgi:hypothetical protein